MLATILLLSASCTDTSNNAPPDAAMYVVGDASSEPAAPDAGVEAPAEDAPPGLEPGYLWFASGPISAFTKSAVAASTDHGPVFTVLPNVDNPNFHDIVFDRSGNLWALSQTGNQIIRCPADTLGNGKPPPIPDIVIISTAMKGAQSLTFDGAGNLWVMNYSGAGLSTASILRFDNPAGALGLVRPDPTLTITPSASGQAAFNQGTGIAFDAAGNLWLAAVANVLRIDQAASLSGAVTAVPSTIISSGNDAYVAAAFDAAGSLWITGARNGYFVTRIDAPGSLTGAVTPSTVTRVHLPSGSAFASGMGFDADGALWIAMSDRIVKLADPRSLSGDITPTPSVVLTKTMPDLATKLVFWPTPPGLPLYR